ncbi:hypothetical protein QCA50_011446 [Cerrena zonata]|uniref:Uncharacterized protein n=1 Tax=Cerrena zonata TaxID=2478898 RepID=A0AAW0G2N0_9APHY
MAVQTIEFNPLVVIAGAAVLCAAISFIVARRNIRARPVLAQNLRRNGEEKPLLVDVYVVRSEKGGNWEEIMPISVATSYDTAIASNVTSQMEIAVAIMMPSPGKQHEPSIQDHDPSRRMSSFSSSGSMMKKMPEEWAESTYRSDESLDYSIGLIEIPCHHRKALEFG